MSRSLIFYTGDGKIKPLCDPVKINGFIAEQRKRGIEEWMDIKR